jgi:hypothetical protein
VAATMGAILRGDGQESADEKRNRQPWEDPPPEEGGGGAEREREKGGWRGISQGTHPKRLVGVENTNDTAILQRP